MAAAMLKIKGLQVNYGGIQAVKGVTWKFARASS
jgi:ABC-type branched-subunit amino acid transport system ATPase component